MRDEKLFISVIIPCLNNENTIHDCISSLLNQDYPKDRYEIIVVDNISTDKTISIIEKLNIKLLTEKIRNPYVSRNHGSRIATGEVLAFIDADCIASENWLDSINWAIANGVDISQGPGHITTQKNIIALYESSRLVMNPDNFWGDAKNLAIRKTVFFRLKGFFEYNTGSDTLLVKKAVFFNYKVKFNGKQVITKKFPENWCLLLKKSWKYGKGEVMWDFMIGTKQFRKNVKRSFKMLFVYIFNFLNAINTQQLTLLTLDLLTKETRYLSYIIYYKNIKTELQQKYKDYETYWPKKQ